MESRSGGTKQDADGRCAMTRARETAGASSAGRHVRRRRRAAGARPGLGLALALALALLLGGGPAGAVSIPTDVFTLPVSDSPSVDLGAPTTAGGPWQRLAPVSASDPVSYFSAALRGARFVSGSGTPSNPWLFDVTFDVQWSGEIGAASTPQPQVDRLLFTIVDARFGTTRSLFTTTDLPSSGFVRGSFTLDGQAVAPQVVRDDTGVASGNPEGFVSDVAGNQWLGFDMPLDTQLHTLQGRFALGQNPGSGGDVFFPTAMFVAVPEPGLALLLAAAGLALAAGRRRTG